MLRLLPLCVLLMAAAAPKSPTVLGKLKSLFDPSLEKTKEKANCTGAWVETPGQGYVTHKCGNAEVMATDGKAFASSTALVIGGSSDEANSAMKAAIKELGAACKKVRDGGQMAIYECPGKFGVILLLNWDSKSDSHSVKALFGNSDRLFSLMGVR